MVQKAYIIIAHKNPQQVSRLMNALDDGCSSFFLHLDVRINLDQFNASITGVPIYWVERVDASWGEFGLTKATLNGLKAIRASRRKFSHIIVLSGQDYPIKSNEAINEFFRRSPYSIFMEFFLLPAYSKWQPNGGMYRVNKYFLGLRAHQKFGAKALNFSASLFPSLCRKMPNNMKPYAGSNWWIIDDYAMHYILDFVDRNPEYVAFHQHTFVADELFFQMILLNATDPKISANILNDNKRFILWKHSAPHPEWLGVKHIDQMLRSNALFARKFDTAKDSVVLDLLDRHRSGSKITQTG